MNNLCTLTRQWDNPYHLQNISTYNPCHSYGLRLAEDPFSPKIMLMMLYQEIFHVTTISMNKVT